MDVSHRILDSVVIIDEDRQKEELMTRLKILIRIIERDRRLRSFTDVIGHGLGPRTQYWLTCFFIVEFLVWK